MSSKFAIVSIKHTERDHKWITLWRPKCANYAWPLEWSGQYSAADVEESPFYFNGGDLTVACRWDVLEHLAVETEIDGAKVRCVPNTRASWQAIMKGLHSRPRYMPAPQFPKARRCRGMHEWPRRRREMDFETRAYLAEHRRRKRGQQSAEAKRANAAQAEADAFNARHAVGAPVRYWPGLKEGPGVESMTRTPAQVLGGHTAVVWVNGRPDCIAITHIDVLAQEGGAK